MNLKFLIPLLLLILAGPLSIMAQEPVKKTLTIAALGDSTTAGTPGFLSPREAPPDGKGDIRSQYAYWLEQSHPAWKVHNRGVGGNRTDQMLKRFDYDVLSFKPDVLVVLGGVNDFYQGLPVAHVTTHLEQIYFKARKTGIQVVACTVLPFDIGSPEVHEKIKEVNAWIRRFAAEKGLIFCDTYGALHDEKRPGKLISTPDDIHPDVEGYKKMAEVIGKAIEENLLAEREASPT